MKSDCLGNKLKTNKNDLYTNITLLWMGSEARFALLIL